MKVQISETNAWLMVYASKTSRETPTRPYDTLGFEREMAAG
jgi:hypothetical protein